MIDTHSHLNFKAFAEDYGAVISRSFAYGVKKIINVGSQLETSQKALEIAKEYKNCYASVGIHPIHVQEINLGWEGELFEMAQNKKVIAIGETGLDYYRQKGQKNKQRQVVILKKHLQIAQRLNLPIILHCREAFEDLLSLLEQAGSLGKLPGVVHCFTGTKEQVKKFLDLGFYLGFTGLVTFVKDLEEVVKFAPLEKILIETDCPYLAPAPYRGKRCEPWMVKFTAEKIDKIKKLCLDEIIQKTDQNAKKLFAF